jgi:hypothetical protein
MHLRKLFKEVAKARHSYRLQPGLARSDKTVSASLVVRRASKKSAKYRKALGPYARARSLRTLRSSTGRSGITIRKVAPMVPSTR